MPPVNDDFANATVISGTSGTVAGTNVGATMEAGEPHFGRFGGNSVWWSWTAAADGVLDVDTWGSRWDADPTQVLDTLLGAYTGASVGALTQLAFSDDDTTGGPDDGLPLNSESGGTTSHVSIIVHAGTTYHFQVLGFDGLQVGAINLDWSEGPPPPPPPRVDSISPDHGCPNQAPIVITGQFFTGATQVDFTDSFGSFSSVGSAFTVDSDTQITVTTTPFTLGAGPWRVIGPGLAGSGTGGSFTIDPQPTITSISPTSGPPGTVIDVIGTNLEAQGPGWDMGGLIACASSPISPTEVLVTVPAWPVWAPTPPTIQALRFVNNCGEVEYHYFTVTSVSLTSISPTALCVGDVVTITGAGFVGVTAVQFGGVPATSYIVDSSTQIRAVVPAGFPASDNVQVFVGATEVTAPYTTGTAPTISSVVPAVAGSGQVVTVNGTGLNHSTGVLTVGGVVTPATIISDSQLTFHAGAVGGPFDVEVATACGAATDVHSLTVFAAPDISPTHGPVFTITTATGTHLSSTSAVTVGGLAAQFIVDSDTTVRIMIPAAAPLGTNTVTLTISSGPLDARELFLVEPPGSGVSTVGWGSGKLAS